MPSLLCRLSFSKRLQMASKLLYPWHHFLTRTALSKEEERSNGMSKTNERADISPSFPFLSSPFPEVARNFKNQGNEYFAGRRFREAQGFYTQAIDAKPLDNALLEILLVNRAACNLALGSSSAAPFPISSCHPYRVLANPYPLFATSASLSIENNRQVLLDCAQALTFNPVSVKALYRTSLAQLALAHYEECITFCDRALAIPGQEGARSHTLVREKAVERWEKLKKKEGETKERGRRKVEEAKALEKALRVSNILVPCSTS